MSKETDGEP